MKRFLLIVLAILSFLAAVKLGARTLFEMQGGFHGDAATYGTVARGILHGLVPYVDLYENKTPAIFLFAAASHWLFDDLRLMSWVQGIIVVLLPFVLLVPVRWGNRFKPSLSSLFVAFLLGTVLALYTAEMAGQLLPESFGAFFGTAFVALMAMGKPGKHPWWNTGALAILLLLAVGSKEPFLVSTLGGALVLFSGFRECRRLLMPLLIAIGAGMIVLAVLGYLVPYITINLAHILGFHIYNPWGTVGVPLWLRTIDVPRIAQNLASFSPFFPWIIGVLWIGSLGLLLRNARTRKQTMGAVARWLLASWLAALAVSVTGDFYGHHFVCAVPVYSGFLLICMRDGYFLPPVFRRLATAVLIMFSVFLLWNAPARFDVPLQTWESWAAPRRHAAGVLDRVMDRCGIDRYLVFIDRPDGIYGFVKHSPYGPLFTEYGRFIGAHPHYIRGFLLALERAEILIAKEGEPQVRIDFLSAERMRNAFTEEPWPCAGADFKQPVPYHILFRNGAH